MGIRGTVKRGIVVMSRATGAEWVRDRILAAQGQLPATILLFHRVTNEIPEDPITVSRERFRMVIRTLREQYHPVTVGELLRRLESGASWPRNTVAVSFDDGYLDNFAYAAPILKELEVPATFFIVADAIESERVMPWDENLPKRLSWMTWNQVREMRQQGFEIGSHTLTHPDLGKIRGETAKREIVDSKKKIQDRLGEEISLFAYPFGRRSNMTEENRAHVREAGYRCCCAVVGGRVFRKSNPFDLLRAPVDRWWRDETDVHYELRTLVWKWAFRGDAGPNGSWEAERQS